jgi:hypothetical protein
VENSTLLADQRQLRHRAPGSFPVDCGGGILTRRASLDVAHVRSYREGGRPQMSPGDRSVGNRHRRGATRQPPGAGRGSPDPALSAGRGSPDPAPLPDRQVSGAVDIAAAQRGKRPALGAGLPTPPPLPDSQVSSAHRRPWYQRFSCLPRLLQARRPFGQAFGRGHETRAQRVSLGGVMRPAPSACRWAGS